MVEMTAREDQEGETRGEERRGEAMRRSESQ